MKSKNIYLSFSKWVPAFQKNWQSKNKNYLKNVKKSINYNNRYQIYQKIKNISI